jgi:S1-C subfamily serine protease
MKVCPTCKVRYSEDNHFCSICGASLVKELTEKQEAHKKWKGLNLPSILGLLAIPIVIIIVGIAFYFNRGPSKPLPPNKLEKAEGAKINKEKVQVISEITSEGYARLVKEVQPAIVTVQTYDRSGEERGLGSGFFINDKGHLITNYHVVKDSYYAIIKFKDGKESKIYTDKAIGIDRKADLIKFHVKLQRTSINYLKITESPPEVGERIVVVGSPLGLEQTVTDGVISGIRQIDDLKIIQISAPISPGSSGGPVVNLKGEVVGVATFYLKGGQNLNFAIPAAKILSLGEGEEEIELAKRSVKAPTFQQHKESLNQFNIDRQWLLEWKSQYSYRGVLEIQKKLEQYRYFSRITVRFLNEKNIQRTVSFDGLLTIRGNDVVIHCSNPTESWWVTDDFYLKWSNDVMEGYSLDKSGRRGYAKLRLVEGY